MPHALLLSPDDQAVMAITGVLEELSVDCERPLDGPTAAQKLHSQSFDLVLVDCENLPAAKLIFDVCRRSSIGTVPIAIVDGRAGLPTAFRLGAELILTKPVAKDQARNTIRTAVSRTRAVEAPRLPKSSDKPAEDVTASVSIPAVAPVLTSAVSTPPSPVPLASASFAAAAATPARTPAPAPAPPAIVGPAAPTIKSGVEQAPKDAADAARLSAMKRPAASALASTSAKVQLPPSDDPIMAELDSPQQPPPAQRSPHPAPQVHAPVFASYQQSQRSSGNGWKLAFLCFLLAGGGIYAAWTYLPPFHQFAQVQIDRGMVLAGRIAQRVTQRQPAHTPPAVPVKAQQATPAAPPAAQPVAAAPAPPSENAAPATSNPISQVSTPAPSPETAPGANPVTVATPAAAEALKAAGTAIDKIPAEDGELPGEKDSIILSSKGAEKRLIHHVEPLYPAEARAHATEGTVVLKAVVNASGSVEATRSVEGDPVLANAAVKAVKQWRYRPYIRDGKALPFHTIIIVEFQRP